MKNLLVTLLFLASYYYSISQDNSKRWQPSVEMNFSTVPFFHASGTDTTLQNAISIAPFFSFRSPAGFGINYSPYFVAGGAHPGIFMHLVTIGLEQYGKKDYELVADYNHFFFTDNSSIPSTPITNEIILGATYKKLWLSPKFSAGIGFGTNKETSHSTSAYDIELTGGISHYFDWKGQNDFSFNVTPSVLLNAGTNEYFSFLKLSKYISHSNNYKSIVKNPHASNKGRGNSGRTTTTTTTTANSTQSISVNNIEINLESTVEHGSVSVRPAASVYVPVSSSKLSGYWELNFSYYF
jgi:hypothetical protein